MQNAAMSKRQQRGPTSFSGPRRKRTPNRDRSAAQAPQDQQKIYDRYISLARAAALTSDRIEMENCYQHAEHYLRLMKEHAAR